MTSAAIIILSIGVVVCAATCVIVARSAYRSAVAVRDLREVVGIIADRVDVVERIQTIDDLDRLQPPETGL